MTDGLRRSWRLFAAFRVEQSDPHRFYGLLARDSAGLISRHQRLAGTTLLDIGAGPAEFADTFERVVHGMSHSTTTRTSRPLRAVGSWATPIGFLSGPGQSM